MLKNFYSPTPKKIRMVGDLMLLLIPVYSEAIRNAPNFTDVEKYWYGFLGTCLLIVGKFVTNFFKENEINK